MKQTWENRKRQRLGLSRGQQKQRRKFDKLVDYGLPFLGFVAVLLGLVCIFWLAAILGL